MEFRTESFERIDKFHWILYFKDEKRLGNIQMIISDIKRYDFCPQSSCMDTFFLTYVKTKNKGKTYIWKKKKEESC